ERKLLGLPPTCFGTGREHKLNLLRKPRLSRRSRQQMDGWFCVSQEPCQEAYSAMRDCRGFRSSRSSERAGRVFFLLTKLIMDGRVTRIEYCERAIFECRAPDRTFQASEQNVNKSCGISSG